MSLAGPARSPNAAAVDLRHWILAAMSACGLASDVPAQPLTTGFQRVRALEESMIQRLHDGYRRSQAFRQVVLALEQSNVIVYVTSGVCDGGRIAGCLLRFVKVSGNTRYLRIVVGSALPTDRAISVVGHELQHAREVADDAAVTDAQGMVSLFRRIGSRECRGVWGECYETKAALDVEDAILKDLGKQYHYLRPMADGHSTPLRPPGSISAPRSPTEETTQ